MGLTHLGIPSLQSFHPTSPPLKRGALHAMTCIACNDCNDRNESEMMRTPSVSKKVCPARSAQGPSLGCCSPGNAIGQPSRDQGHGRNGLHCAAHAHTPDTPQGNTERVGRSFTALKPQVLTPQTPTKNVNIIRTFRGPGYQRHTQAPVVLVFFSCQSHELPGRVDSGRNPGSNPPFIEGIAARVRPRALVYPDAPRSGEYGGSSTRDVP